MPTYCFTNPITGERMEKVWSISEMEKNDAIEFYKDKNGVVWNRAYATEFGGSKFSPSNWPMKSDAAGVHPDQIPDARKESSKLGVPTDFDTKTGQAMFTSRSHRANYLKAKGFHDRNGGYSDG